MGVERSIAARNACTVSHGSERGSRSPRYTRGVSIDASRPCATSPRAREEAQERSEMRDGVLQALATDARPVDAGSPRSALVQRAQSARDLLVSEKGEQLADRRGVVRDVACGEAAHPLEMGAVPASNFGPGGSVRRAEHVTPRSSAQRADQRGEADVVLRIPRSEERELRSAQVTETTHAPRAEQDVERPRGTDAHADRRGGYPWASSHTTNPSRCGPSRGKDEKRAWTRGKSSASIATSILVAPPVAQSRAYAAQLCEVAPTRNRVATRLSRVHFT